ncbi:hypothetical protein [Methanolobus sp. ZRKC5]
MKNNDIGEDELEELFEKQLQKKGDQKHRGYGDYERRRIYRGPDVKRDPE